MKSPLWMRAIAVVLFIVAVVGLVLAVRGCDGLLRQTADFALILTLVSLMFYTYYTFLIAKDTWTPAASFALIALDGHPYHFWFVIQNHSKKPVRCWCRLNASVDGREVELGGFYSREAPINAQPFGTPQGHFDIVDQILVPLGHTVAEMKGRFAPDRMKEQLYLNVEFWYEDLDTGKLIRRVNQPHYFDFSRDVMVADF